MVESQKEGKLKLNFPKGIENANTSNAYSVRNTVDKLLSEAVGPMKRKVLDQNPMLGKEEDISGTFYFISDSHKGDEISATFNNGKLSALTYWHEDENPLNVYDSASISIDNSSKGDDPLHVVASYMRRDARGMGMEPISSQTLDYYFYDCNISGIVSSWGAHKRTIDYHAENISEASMKALGRTRLPKLPEQAALDNNHAYRSFFRSGKKGY